MHRNRKTAILRDMRAPKRILSAFCVHYCNGSVACLNSNTCGEYLFEKERQSLDKLSRIPYNIYRAANSEDNYPLDLTFRRTE